MSLLCFKPFNAFPQLYNKISNSLQKLTRPNGSPPASALSSCSMLQPQSHLSGPRYVRLFLHSWHCSLHLAHVPPSSWMAGSPSFYGWAQLSPPSRCWPTLWKLPHAPSFSAILLHHGTYSHQSTLFTCSLHTGSLLCAISCHSSGTQKRLVSRLNK